MVCRSASRFCRTGLRIVALTGVHGKRGFFTAQDDCLQFFVDKIERLFYFQADPLVAEAVKPIKIIDIVGTSM